MGRVAEVAVYIADLKRFKFFIAAAGEVIRTYDERGGDSGDVDLGVAVGVLRSALLDLKGDDT
jgi:hypothetical protein